MINNLKIINNNNYNYEIKNNFNNSCILKNTYSLETQNNKNDKNNNYLIDETKKHKDNFDKISYNFISELRKMTESKDNKKRHSNILYQSKLYNIIPPILAGVINNKIKKEYNNNYNLNNNINNENNLINNINIMLNKNKIF